MTNEQILNLYEGLYEISQDDNIHFDALTSFILAKNKNMIEPVYSALIETRNTLIQSYGNVSDDQGSITIPPDKISAFKIEYDTLMRKETYVNLEKINIKSLINYNIKISIMEKLLPIIEYNKKTED